MPIQVSAAKNDQLTERSIPELDKVDRSKRKPELAKRSASKNADDGDKGQPKYEGEGGFWFALKGFFNIQGARIAPPCARLLNDLSTPQESWVSLYVLPFPDQMADLPPRSKGEHIDVWTYGAWPKSSARSLQQGNAAHRKAREIHLGQRLYDSRFPQRGISERSRNSRQHRRLLADQRHQAEKK
jgi:hypothetical protein